MQGARYSCLTLMKLEFSWQIRFHENPSSGGHVVPCGQTDRRDEDNSHSSQFCERA